MHKTDVWDESVCPGGVCQYHVVRLGVVMAVLRHTLTMPTTADLDELGWHMEQPLYRGVGLVVGMVRISLLCQTL